MTKKEAIQTHVNQFEHIKLRVVDSPESYNCHCDSHPFYEYIVPNSGARFFFCRELFSTTTLGRTRSHLIN